MSLKQFVWNLAGRESMIPEDELPEAEEEQEAWDANDLTHIQENPEEEPDNATFGEFLSGLVTGEAEDPTTPVLDSTSGTPKQTTSLLGQMLGGSNDPPTPAQDSASSPSAPSLGSLFGFGKSSTGQAEDSLQDAPKDTSLIGRLFGSTEVDNVSPPPQPSSPVKTPEVQSPSSPLSFIGGFFVPSPPAMEAIPPPPTTGGFGNFLAGLVGGGEPKLETGASKLEVLADSLHSPTAMVKQTPLDQQVHEAVAFDRTDADDEVERIERLRARPASSKKLARLLVANEEEAHLRLAEAEAAMDLLRKLQNETRAAHPLTLPERSNKTTEETPQVEMPKQKSDSGESGIPQLGKGAESKGWNLFGFSDQAKAVEPVPGAVKKEDPPKQEKVDTVNTSPQVLEKVSRVALERAKSVLKEASARRNGTKPIKGSDILHHKNTKPAAKPTPPHRAHHSFEPVAGPSSMRLNLTKGFDESEGRSASFSSHMSLLGDSRQKQTGVVVTSVESRPLHRPLNAWDI